MKKTKFKRVFTGSYTGKLYNLKKVYDYISEDERYEISSGKGCMDWDKPFWKMRDTKTDRVSMEFTYLKDAKEFGIEYIEQRHNK